MNGNWRNKLIYKLSTTLKVDLSKLSSLTNEQLVFINHNIGFSSFLEACPGSGKTEVVGLKGALEIKKWNSINKGIAIVTFTTSAAKELNERVRKFADLTSGLHPHFIGTFDSWLHSYVFQPFCHYRSGFAGTPDGDKSIRIIDDDSHAGFLNNYLATIRINQVTYPFRPTEYHFNSNWTAPIGHNEIIKNLIPRFSAQDIQILKQSKNRFIRDGFSTYADAESLSVRILQGTPHLQQKLAARFPIIFIDECQDLSDVQLEILELLRVAGIKLHFVGDLNQSIYEFREVNPQNIQQYIHNNGFVKLRLTSNFRSCQNIVDVSNSFIGNAIQILAHENQIIPDSCILWQYNNGNFTNLPTRFEQLVEQHILRKGKCAILARAHSTIQELRTQRDKYKISKVELFATALDCWFKSNRNTEDITNAINYLGRFLCSVAFDGQGNSREQFCPHGTDAIDWRVLIKKTLNSSAALYPFENNGNDINWTNWVALLKQHLAIIWPTFKSIKQFNQIQASLRAPTGRTQNPVKDIGSASIVHNAFRTTTIHSVKGETLDAVLLISHRNAQSDGGHYSHWLNGANQEHLRFAYVACSRPKHLLVIACPTLQQADINRFTQMGFVVR